MTGGARVTVRLTCLLALGVALAASVHATRAPRTRPVPAPPPAVAFQPFGSAAPLDALSDGNVATEARLDSSPGRLFLLLGDEALLAAVVVNANGRAGAVSVQASADALNWTAAPVRVRPGARPGETRYEFLEPVSARALTLTIPFSGRRLGIREIRLEPVTTAVPRVSAVTVTGIGQHAATVSWRTDRPAATSLLYGYRPDGMRSAGPPSYETRREHSVRLDGLLPGTEYRAWIVVGRDSVVGVGGDEPLKFRTTGTPLPFAGGFRHAYGRDTAEIRFSVNIPARAALAWRPLAGGAPRTAKPASGDAVDTAHVVCLDGLTPRAEYEYQVEVTDSGGRTTLSPWIAFATAPYNLALGCTVTGTFDRLLDEQAAADTRPALARVTDGRDDYFRGMATSGDPGETDQWVEVDLGRPSRLASIEMVWRGNAYPRAYYVATSFDGASWAYPGFGVDAGAGTFDRSSGGDPLRRVRLDVEAVEPVRFIRIFIPRGSGYHSRSGSWRFVQLAEIEAHGHWGR